jgi:cytoskeletal protein CcmA (bactofilin family)
VRAHNRRKLLQHPQKKLSIVEKGLTIDGAVSFKGQLIVKGTIKGTLIGDHVVIEEDGLVVADTQVAFITVGGAFRGKLTVSGKLVLLSTGNCSGIFECQEMEMEPGAVLNGEVNCSK